MAAALGRVDLDPAFPQVLVPSQEFSLRVGEEPDAFHLAPAAALMAPSAYSSSVLRGEVEEDELSAVVASAENEGMTVYADVAVHPCSVCPGDPPRGTERDVEQLLGTDDLFRARMDGSGVLVAVVDSGINFSYLERRGKRPRFDASRSWAPAGGGIPGSQPIGHGTMCAYDVCIAAPNCTLLDISLLRSTARGGSAMEGLLSDAILAYSHLLRVLASPGRPGESPSLVVTNSWGMFNRGWDFPIDHSGNYSDNPGHPFNVIVATLERAGADILFAAGNCGPGCPDLRCEGVVDAGILGANSHPAVLCVAGVDVSGSPAGYSSEGPGRLVPEKPDIAAFTHFAGSGVYAADGGTSAACPVAAGVVAGLRTRMPSGDGDRSPRTVRDVIRAGALRRSGGSFDHRVGYGIVSGRAVARHPIPDSARITASVEALVQSFRDALEPPLDRADAPAPAAPTPQ